MAGNFITSRFYFSKDTCKSLFSWLTLGIKIITLPISIIGKELFTIM